jgi:PilZ domain
MHENQTAEGPSGGHELNQNMAGNFDRAVPGRKTNFQQKILHLRRSHSRVQALVNVYIFWRSDGREDVATVKNLSFSGLFIETEKSKDPGDAAELHFLVQEGQIRADAVVRRAKPGHGLGLRLMAVHNNDRGRLAELMKRLRRGA